MDAIVYQLDDLRRQHSSRMFMEKFSVMPMTSGGLELLTSATAFWVAYSAAMVSCHHKVLSAAFSPCLRLPKATEAPSGWRW